MKRNFWEPRQTFGFTWKSYCLGLLNGYWNWIRSSISSGKDAKWAPQEIKAPDHLYKVEKGLGVESNGEEDLSNEPFPFLSLPSGDWIKGEKNVLWILYCLQNYFLLCWQNMLMNIQSELGPPLSNGYHSLTNKMISMYTCVYVKSHGSSLKFLVSYILIGSAE